jgi:hypothetical protein
LRRAAGQDMLLAVTDSLRDALCGIDGVVESDSAFTRDLAFWVNGKEIAHFEGPGAIDLRLTRPEISARRAQLRGDPRVELRRGSSDWLTVRFDSDADRELVVELFSIAAAAHRAPPGTTQKQPPSGAELERRRRFH